MESSGAKVKSTHAMSNAPGKGTKDDNTPTPTPAGSHSRKENDESNPEHHSANSIVVVLGSPPGPEPLDDPLMANRDQYGCKYCAKKFSNKQALGGHQNAHKFERSMEREAHPFHYFGGFATQPRLPVLPGSIIRPPFVTRPVPGIAYSFPAGGMTFSPYHVPGFNRVYSGWNASVPRISHAGSPYSMQYPAMNPQFLGNRMGNSSASPVFRNHPAVAVPPSRIVPATFGVPNNNQDEEVAETDLDLSLRL